LAIFELSNTKPDKKALKDIKSIVNLEEILDKNAEEFNLI
jgi:hypothetical protein